MWYFFSGLERKEEELGSFSASFSKANSKSNLTAFLPFLHLGKGRTQDGSKEKKEGRIFKSNALRWVSLVQHLKGFWEISVSLAYFQVAGKANQWNKFKMLTSLKAKLLGSVGRYGYTEQSAIGCKYKTIYCEENLRSRKTLHMFPWGLIISRKGVLRQGVVEPDPTGKELQQTDPTSSSSSYWKGNKATGHLWSTLSTANIF